MPIETNQGAARQLVLSVVIQVLAISCWFNTAATVPSIARELNLELVQTSGLTMGVQGGFAVGAITLALLRASDRVAPHWLIAFGALGAALFTATPVLFDLNFAGFLVTRILVGLSLATVYSTGMRVVLSWAPSATRGLAVAGLVGALTVGTAAPHLVAGSLAGSWRPVMVVTALLAAIAAGLSLFTRTGPYVSQVRPVTLRQALGVVREPTQRRITAGYIGHMWEVYGMWVWLPSLLLSLPALNALPAESGSSNAGLWTFLIIGVAGTIGCLVGGFLPTRYGKRRTARVLVVISAACVLATPFLGFMPFFLAVAILGVWGAVSIGDSALYSAMTGDASGGAAVGTAIALQMGIGYTISIVIIYLLPLAADQVGWQYAFLILLIGPVVSFMSLKPNRLPMATMPGESVTAS